MIIVVIAGLALVLLVWAGRAGKPMRIRREWRFIPALAAIVCFIGALIAGVKEALAPALLLALLGLSFAATARGNARQKAPAPPREAMTLAEARAILGVGPGAGPEEVKAAYTRLMRMAHPDKGGTTGLAIQLNAARDRLLGG